MSGTQRAKNSSIGGTNGDTTQTNFRGTNGGNGTPRRKYANRDLACDIVGAAIVEKAGTPIPEPISILRSKPGGKDILAAQGRDGKECVRRPGASIARRFVAWDGEGITFSPGSAQNYVLFGNSSGHYIQGTNLGTSECLSLMIRAEQAEPNAYHVAFAFTYDVNMILKDLPRERLERLHKEGFIRWRNYRIEWRKGKWFQVSANVRSETGRNERVTCRIWDIWSFFQSSFVVALRKYLGERKEFDEIEAGKNQRGEFQWDELETMVVPYWRSELEWLVKLADRLRSYLYSADLPITQWHGPGAIASYALRKHHIAEHMAECPDEVNDAAMYAYAGGRFEHFKLGRIMGPVWQYDINSAYPEAISLLPSLQNGTWERVDTFDRKRRFAVYRVRLSGPLLRASVPYPLFMRDEKHCIHYPPLVEGWYWAPEVANIHDWEHVEILDGWVFHDDGTYPFAWVREVYEQRREWKRIGNPCEKALKLLLNSLYGKMAQRVGWDKEKGKPPKWHQLEWAGWVTSYARAKLYRAMLAAGDGLIACETDSVFSTKKLPVTVGEGLGEWSEDVWDEVVYLQSGFRFVRSGDDWKSAYRGMDKDSVVLSDVISFLRNVKLHDRTSSPPAFHGRTTRFIGMGLAFQTSETRWRVWETEDRKIQIGATGKRIHVPPMCRACRRKASPYDLPHDLAVGKPQGGKSVPHAIPWKLPLDYWKEAWIALKENRWEEIEEV